MESSVERYSDEGPDEIETFTENQAGPNFSRRDASNRAGDGSRNERAKGTRAPGDGLEPSARGVFRAKIPDEAVSIVL